MTQPHEVDLRWMRRAIELSFECPLSQGAYSVGAVIVDAAGNELSNGFSRETDHKVHAEESALTKLPTSDARIAGATIYSSLEPCSQRASRPKSCSQLIVEAGIRRVVIAWREPSLFVAECVGVELLQSRGIEVIELPELAADAKRPNTHLNLS